MQSWQAEWERRKAEALDIAWKRMMREPCRLYLYFRPSNGRQWGEFLVVVEGEEPEPGTAELVTAEAIPRHLERCQLSHWLNKFAGQLPMIPTEG